ncbi:hypothetical protein [Bradyrhizobium monzae]|uniref:hypothetical protein n=1 Tax=Bradyrhizobium sp. Oc8 TaxID=2876780 RepID=UPI001F2A7F61|nr:hypothetical protein [Bradyrhizobium sp. Oc8]
MIHQPVVERPERRGLRVPALYPDHAPYDNGKRREQKRNRDEPIEHGNDRLAAGERHAIRKGLGEEEQRRIILAPRRMLSGNLAEDRAQPA